APREQPLRGDRHRRRRYQRPRAVGPGPGPPRLARPPTPLPRPPRRPRRRLRPPRLPGVARMIALADRTTRQPHESRLERDPHSPPPLATPVCELTFASAHRTPALRRHSCEIGAARFRRFSVALARRRPQPSAASRRSWPPLPLGPTLDRQPVVRASVPASG